MNSRSVPVAIACSVVVSVLTCIVAFRCLIDYSFFPLGTTASSIGMSFTAQSYILIAALVLSVLYAAFLSKGRVALSGAMAFMVSLAAAGVSVSGYVGIPVVQAVVLAVLFVGVVFVCALKQPGPVELGVALVSGVMTACFVTFAYYSFTHEPMEQLPEDSFSPRQITQAEWLDWGADTTAAWVVSVVRQEEAHLLMTEGAPVHAAILPLSTAATYENGVILINTAMLHGTRPDYSTIKKFEWRSRASGEEPTPYKFQRGVGPNALAVGAAHAALLELIVRAQDDEALWKGWHSSPEKLPEGRDYPQSDDPTYKLTWNYGLSRYGNYIVSGFVTDSSGTVWEGRY